MRILAFPLTLLVACGGPETPAPLVGGDTCTALVDGVWDLTGPAWGMGDQAMTGTVTMNVTDCTFTLDRFDMSMDDLPTGGVVDGDQVQLDGLTSKWRTCSGTAADERTVDGTCTEDGSTFSMAGPS